MRWQTGKSSAPRYTPFQVAVLRLYNQARAAHAAQSQRIEDWTVRVWDDGQLELWREAAPKAARSAYVEAAHACAAVLGWTPNHYQLTWQGTRLRALLMQGVFDV